MRLATIRGHLIGNDQSRSLREIPSFFIMAFNVVRGTPRRIAASIKGTAEAVREAESATENPDGSGSLTD
jgi:hypothetical protein